MVTSVFFIQFCYIVCWPLAFIISYKWLKGILYCLMGGKVREKVANGEYMVVMPSHCVLVKIDKNRKTYNWKKLTFLLRFWVVVMRGLSC
jgi:hypothetical protein